IARNLVAAGVADEVLVQVAYAIGVARPVSLYVNTYGTAHVNMTDAEISAKVDALFDMRPHSIEQRFGLRKPIYLETSTYGHFGREPRRITKRFHSPYEKEERLIDVELFAWEKEDMVSELRKAFSLE
ncbi:MAG: methionine adenosyltransferase domain-containing protein, partial [Muribaculaceae bacterium]|nr:methionine adenosyltransferase domain-containing protein [Muribaculaceae bacterium]